MNKLFGGLLVAFLITAPLTASAAAFQVGEQPSVGRDQTIADDLYIVGGNITGSGSVDGDVLAAGGNVLISGPATGDVQVAGGNVTLLGEVADDVRAMGGTIIISGAVGDDVVVVGGQVTVSGERVGGDVVAFAGVVHIDTPVEGSMRVAAGEVFLNATVAGDVDIEAERIVIGQNASIAGELTYTSPEEADIHEGASIASVAYTPREQHVSAGADREMFAALSFFGAFFIHLVAALLIGLLLRRFAKEVVGSVVAQPLAQLGRGLIVLIVVPIASVLLLFTFIGIPFGIIGILAYIAWLIFSGLVAPIVLGALIARWILKRCEKLIDWKTITAGVAVYVVLGLIPVIGWLLQLILVVLVLGATLRINMDIVNEWR